VRRLFCAFLVAGALFVAACSPSTKATSDHVRVVASFYPLAEIARQVGGGFVEVVDLTPAGVEPHDVELTTDDVDAIEDADLVLRVGGGFQPAVETAAKRRGSNGSVELGPLVGDGSGDPHFWLDPTRMEKATLIVRDALNEADPLHVQQFKDNAATYIAQLQSLDARYETSLTNCDRRDVVTAHAAFGYLARRYDLRQQAITGLAPESEPSPSRLVELERFVKEHGVTTVFFETLLPRDFADTLAKEAGVTTAVLDPIEGLTKAAQQRHDDYISVMGRNREALVKALGCR
jgi:zinc transport system substrate-binding protein